MTSIDIACRRSMWGCCRRLIEAISEFTISARCDEDRGDDVPGKTDMNAQAAHKQILAVCIRDGVPCRHLYAKSIVVLKRTGSGKGHTRLSPESKKLRVTLSSKARSGRIMASRGVSWVVPASLIGPRSHGRDIVRQRSSGIFSPVRCSIHFCPSGKNSTAPSLRLMLPT